MQIRLVAPRRFDELKDSKPTTFFWLECNPQEALEVLLGTEADAETLISYYNDIQAAKAYLEENPQDKFDYSINSGLVGMLFASDGRRLEYVEPLFPYHPIFDDNNQFVRIDPLRVGTLADLWEIGDYLCDENPRLSDRLEWDDVPDRVDLKKLGQLDIEKYVRDLPKTIAEGLEADDDQLAMAIFSFMESPTGPFVWPSGLNGIAPDLVIELGKEWSERGTTTWWDEGDRYISKFEILSAQEISLYEIYQRRARAEHNLARLLGAIQGHDQISGALLRLFSLDEICEMLLLAWTCEFLGASPYWEVLKPLLFEIGSRIRPSADEEGPWYRLELERMEWEHTHEFRTDPESQTNSIWPFIHENAERIARSAHENQKDKAGRTYIDHPYRVVQNVRSYERFIWEHDPKRLLDQGGKHVANIIDAAIAAAWLHDVIEDSGEHGEQITAQQLLSSAIPAQVVEAVMLLTDDQRVPREIEPGLQRKSLKTQLKLDYYKKIKENEVARIVKIADLADNNNVHRAAAMRAAGGYVDPAKYPLALAALELTPEEWKWFNEAIKKQVS
jgi:hypothetical protein